MGKEQYVIRLLRQEDVPQMRELDHILFPIKYNDAVYQEFLSQAYLSLVLVKIEEQTETIIGEATANRQWKTSCSLERDGYLATFGIHPDYRRHHFGSLLFQVISEILMTHFECRVLRLHMLVSNDSAYEFYLKQGMTVTKMLNNFYTIDGKKADAYLMSAELSSIKMTKLPNFVKYGEDVQNLLLSIDPVGWFRRLFGIP